MGLQASTYGTQKGSRNAGIAVMEYTSRLRQHPITRSYTLNNAILPVNARACAHQIVPPKYMGLKRFSPAKVVKAGPDEVSRHCTPGRPVVEAVRTSIGINCTSISINCSTIDKCRHRRGRYRPDHVDPASCDRVEVASIMYAVVKQPRCPLVSCTSYRSTLPSAVLSLAPVSSHKNMISAYELRSQPDAVVS